MDKLSRVGICGSDLTSYETGAYVTPDQVLGHEFSAPSWPPAATSRRSGRECV